MAEVTLEVSRRESTGKGVARKLRASGRIPAVVYGGHRDPVAIEVDRKSVVVVALKALADEGSIDASTVTKAMTDLGVDADKPNPVNE